MSYSIFHKECLLLCSSLSEYKQCCLVLIGITLPLLSIKRAGVTHNLVSTVNGYLYKL